MKRSQFHSTMPSSSSSSSTVSDQLIRTPWKSGFVFLIEKDREEQSAWLKYKNIWHPKKQKTFKHPFAFFKVRFDPSNGDTFFMFYTPFTVSTPPLHFFSLSSWLQNERHLFKSNCSNHICSIEVYLNQIARIVLVQLIFVRKTLVKIRLLESHLFL
jgi:hypothetical protein